MINWYDPISFHDHIYATLGSAEIFCNGNFITPLGNLKLDFHVWNYGLGRTFQVTGTEL